MVLSANLTAKLHRMFPKRNLGPLRQTDYDFLRLANAVIYPGNTNNNRQRKSGIKQLQSMIAGREPNFTNIWPNNWNNNKNKERFVGILKRYGVNRSGLMKLYVEAMILNRAQKTGMTLNQKQALKNRANAALLSGFKYIFPNGTRPKHTNVPISNSHLAKFLFRNRNGGPWKEVKSEARRRKLFENTNNFHTIVEVLPAFQKRYPNIQAYYKKYTPDNLNATKKYVSLNNYMKFRSEQELRHRYASANALRTVQNKLRNLARKSTLKLARASFFHHGQINKNEPRNIMKIKTYNRAAASAAANAAKANKAAENARKAHLEEWARLIRENQQRRAAGPHNTKTWARNNAGTVSHKRKSLNN